jgi:hypothetical protein
VLVLEGLVRRLIGRFEPLFHSFGLSFFGLMFFSAKQTFLTLCDLVESRSPVKDGRDQGILMFSKVWMVSFY